MATMTLLRILTGICLLICARGEGRVELSLLAFYNPGGHTADGRCCDSLLSSNCQENDCDYVFTICVDEIDSVNNTENCAYVNVVTANIDDQQDMVFENKIGGIDNPMIFHFEGETPSFKVKVKVEDDDGWYSNRDLVGLLDYNFTPEKAVTTIETQTMDGRIWLLAEVKIICDEDFYGGECVHCAPSTEGQYTCAESGEKFCTPEWTGDQCDSKLKPVPRDPMFIDRENIDCSRIGGSEVGVFTINPSTLEPFDVYCLSAHTLIQRNVNNDISFYKDWEDYRNGFGSPEYGNNFWVGLEKIYHMTNTRDYSLVIVLTVADGSERYETYNRFWLESEAEGYRLHAEGADGDAGNAFGFVRHGLKMQNRQRFTTFDQDNDIFDNGNCAERYSSGWWYSNCQANNLNARITGAENNHLCQKKRCMTWDTISKFKGFSLLQSEMYLF